MHSGVLVSILGEETCCQKALWSPAFWETLERKESWDPYIQQHTLGGAEESIGNGWYMKGSDS